MCDSTPPCACPLSHTFEAPAQARAFVREQACRAHPGDLDTVMLLVSEVVTNAIRHAKPPVTVTFECRGPICRLGIEDGDPDVASVHAQGTVGNEDERRALCAEGGRGLDLVDALALRWHVAPTAPGKTVWLDVAC